VCAATSGEKRQSLQKNSQNLFRSTKASDAVCVCNCVRSTSPFMSVIDYSAERMRLILVIEVATNVSV
jgi:hypothetical protein